MIAVRMHAFGPAEVLQIEQVTDPPAPTGDQLLIGVEASSINGTDLGLRRGDLKVATWGRMPFTLGFDLVGTVLRCGPAVTSFVPGERVVALLDHGGGAQAGQVVAPQGRAAAAPTACAFEEAAALPLAGLTALQALYERAGLGVRPLRSRVLVAGATGGIGTFGVQLAAMGGAHVTAMGSGAKLTAVVDLGADAVLDRQIDDPAHVGERWDVVLDAHGSMSARRARGLLRSGGVLVSVRPISRDALAARVVPGLAGPGTRFTSVMTDARPAGLARLARLVDAGRLRIVVDPAFPVSQAVAAHQRAEGAAVGKVVLRLGGESGTP